MTIYKRQQMEHWNKWILTHKMYTKDVAMQMNESVHFVLHLDIVLQAISLNRYHNLYPLKAKKKAQNPYKTNSTVQG